MPNCKRYLCRVRLQFDQGLTAQAAGRCPARPDGPSGRKPIAVGLRCRAELAQEATAHRLLGAEAALRGDALHRASDLEQVARGLDAELLDGPRWSPAGRPAVVADKAALAHAGGAGERRNREVAAKVVDDPSMQALEAGVA